MGKSKVTFILALVPSIALAQKAASSVQGSASATAAVSAKTPTSQASVNGDAHASTTTSSTDVPSTYSAENRAKLEATFAAARERNLPAEPIRDRVAEGRAKGAGEAQVVLAAQHTEARLEATQSAMIRAGRREPSQAEVTSGNQAMVRGATEAQVQAVAQHTPTNRSLVVALDALARLQAQGMSSDRAAARVVASLEAKASDQSIGQLTSSTAAQASGTAVVPGGTTTAAGSVAGSATVAGKAGTAATAGVAGAVGAVVKPPLE